MIALTSCATAQNVELPAPQTEQKSLSMVETLKTRHSVRDYDKEKSLTLQEISNVCWAANGVSRDAEHRTAPSAMNRQEIRLFVLQKRLCMNTLHRKIYWSLRLKATTAE